MKTIAANKYWKYLFWLGPVLVVMGLSAGVVSGNWEPVPLGLVIAGIVTTGLWLLFTAREINWWGRRSTQTGTNALVATLSVLVILGLVNFLAIRYPVRVDLTETHLFTLAPESRQLVRNLPSPVKVWVFDRNQDAQDRELLENYRRLGQQFSFEYVDPQARLGLAQKFGVKQFGEVYLEAGQRRQLLQLVNEQQRLSEVKLTNGLEQIQRGSAKVYFLQNHGEHPLSAGPSALSQALSVLKDKNYTASPLNLAQQPVVPKDAAVVVVAGPKRALFAQEVKALSDYLNQGGSLLLMIDPNTNPGLDSLLKNWGVRLDNRLAVDVSGGVGLGPAVPIVTDYGNHPITKDFGNGISFYRQARPIETTPVALVQVTPLLLTKPYPQSWAQSDLKSDSLQFNPESDRQGPLTLGVALSRKVDSKSDKKPVEARLVVLGNSDFATDGLFDQQLNGDVFLNSVSWLSKQDQQPLSIRPKEAKNRRINMTPQQANLLALTSLLLVPFIGFGTAALLWWQRR